jgi:hypothetical protein
MGAEFVDRNARIKSQKGRERCKTKDLECVNQVRAAVHPRLISSARYQYVVRIPEPTCTRFTVYRSRQNQQFLRKSNERN